MLSMYKANKGVVVVENLHVSLFGTVLSISDNIMHYQ